MMKFLDKLFGKAENHQDARSDLNDPIIPVPIPPLVAVLLNLEREKGSTLTEAEVLEIRDNAVCMTMPLSVRDQVAAKRGYDDINPEYVWEEWIAIRPSLLTDDD